MQVGAVDHEPCYLCGEFFGEDNVGLATFVEDGYCVAIGEGAAFLAAYYTNVGYDASVAYLVVGQVALHIFYETVIAEDDVAEDGVVDAATAAEAFVNLYRTAEASYFHVAAKGDVAKP